MEEKIKEITIRKIDNNDREFLAYFKSDFLQATFCVVFSDTVFGAVALNKFSEMIKTYFNEKKLDLFISDEKIKFKSQALLEELIKCKNYVKN